VQDTYKISRRIEAEESALDAATMVIASTQQEVDLQWYAPAALFVFSSAWRTLAHGSLSAALNVRRHFALLTS
jgi:hypothetical protein